MRYLVAVLVAVMLSCGIAYAEQTGSTFWHSHSYVDKVGAADRYSEYQEKQNMALGLGLDAVLYEFDGTLKDYGLDSVNTEYKYDMANNNQSVYGVVHVNVWKAVKKLL